jgi:uncharacterized protein YecE (DUF72 family)
MRIQVGTSGYNYPEWRGTFYPEGFPAGKMFGFYSERFHTVEINATFYRMPTPKTTGAWREQAPPGFSYALKAPRRITHEARLRDCEEHVRFFCDSARVLGPHAGPLLFQLPPNFAAKPDRLAALLEWVPDDLRIAFEFRHDSWLTDDVYALLAGRRAALCTADFGDRTTPVVTTARHAYFRLRDEGYTPEDLERWAETVLSYDADWDDVFVYFKHEDEGKGPEFARAFVDILSRRGATVA